MPIKLLVTRTTDASPPDEYVFHQDAFTIGRDSSNQLTLPDLKRVVSKQHAELRRQDDGAYRITDLGSKNFTYINDERIQSGKPYDVGPGDSIRIGEFEIRLEPVRPPEPNHDATVFDVSFVNPFADDVEQLAEALQRIHEAYDREAPTRRDDALQEALQDVLSAEVLTTYDIVGQMMDPDAPSPNRQRSPFAGRGSTTPGPEKGTTPSPEKGATSPPEKPASIPADQGRPATPPAGAGRFQAHEDKSAPTPSPPHSRKDRPRDVPSLRTTPPSRVEAAIDVLVNVAARLVNIPWQFRHEFIGQTIMQSAESGAIYSGDADALRAYVLDENIAEEEAERRLDLLAHAGEQVALHQVAMLDGYRAGALQGTQRLLDEIDPDAAEAAARQEGGLNRLLSFRASDDALDLLRKKLHELRAEDWSVAERRIFRPAFIKAYLARMTSQRR